MKNLLISLMCIVLSIGIIQAQEQNTEAVKDDKLEDIKINIKDKIKTVVYIDGVQYHPNIIDLLDQNKIESVEVLKGDKAIKKFGAQAAIFISSKNSEKKAANNSASQIGEGKGQIIIIGVGGDKNKPKFSGSDYAGIPPQIYIDGVLKVDFDLKQISPEMIESISVLKDKTAIEKFNAPHGVILITTKKK